MIQHRWNICVHITDYKEEMLYNQLHKKNRDIPTDNDRYPTEYASIEAMTFFKAFSLYLRFSKMGIYSFIYKEEKDLNQKTKLIYGGSVFAILICAGLLLFFTLIAPLNKYNSAVQMISDRQYDKAATVFESMIDYKDSKIRLKQIEASKLFDQGKYMEAINIYSTIGEKYNLQKKEYEEFYKNAEALKENGDYDNAILAFQSIGSYKDSQERIVQTKAERLFNQGKFDEAYEFYSSIDIKYNTHSNEYENIYNRGVQLKNEGSLDSAFELFQALGGYKDSRENCNAIVNYLIEKYKNEKDYAKVQEYYLLLGNVSEANEAALLETKEQKYRAAKILMNEGRYTEAAESFKELGDYEDSKILVDENNYAYAEVLMRERKYIEAEALFALLGSYRDSAKLHKEAIYLRASTYVKEGKYIEAADLFASVGDYADSNERKNEAKYLKAQENEKNGYYIEAINLLAELGNYNSADLHLKELREEYINSNWNELFFAVGNTITYGSYDQDNNYENGNEAIEWIVLDRNEDSVLVITKYAIECFPYGYSRNETTWETSKVRHWLNVPFYNSFLTTLEREGIKETTVLNQYIDGYNTNPGLVTNDYLFLLNYNEVKKYFTNDEDRKVNATIHARQNGANYPQCFWMTRSPGKKNDELLAVKNNGQMDYSTPVDDQHLGVRPAMWLDLNSPVVRMAAMKKGTIVTFGKYGELEKNTYEGLKWKIIGSDEYTVTLLADKAVDNQQFNSERKYITWETSELRKWLNSSFINLAFNKNEKAFLLDMNVKLDEKDGINGYYGMNTTTVSDKVTLLSYRQLVDLFPERDERKARVTEYAKSKGAGGNTTEYWLISSGRDEISMGIINQNGDPDSRWVTDRRGVRPVIKVSLLFGLEAYDE